MKIIYNSRKYHKKIRESIRKFGKSAEHNRMHFFYMEGDKDRNVVFDFGKKRLILASITNGHTWALFPDGILAPEDEKYRLLKRFLGYALAKKRAHKVLLEVNSSLRDEIANQFARQKKYRARKPCILYWPVYDMANWDPKLKGKKWKKLRNIKNRFYKDYRVRAVKSASVSKEKLREIVHSWLRKRSATERVNKGYYLNIINNNFRGFKFARTLLVNNKPCAITAGWKIPNSDREYYSSIGIFNYGYKNLGDICNMDDLNTLKRHGFKHVDFGGSNKTLLAFKKKFKPYRIYKTYIFFVVRA